MDDKTHIGKTRFKENLMLRDRDALIQMIEYLQVKLERKNADLVRVRLKLNAAKTRVMKMKDTVAFQRRRILELHR
jgi:hypothetical protein